MVSTASTKGGATNLEEMVQELLMVLSDKERAVITHRFSLDNEPRKTLESIGQKFAVTRERIRQIEATALRKLQRNASNTKIKRVSGTITQILGHHGGLCREKQIITEVLSKLHGPESPVNGHIVRLALSITPGVLRSDSPKSFHRFWYQKSMTNMSEVKSIAKCAYQVTNKKGDVITTPELVEKTAKGLQMEADAYEKILAVISADVRFRKIDENHWGLQEWRHINPKSIHDKALIIMRKHNQPMHFIEIANTISSEGFDNRPVTVQAVHNDLIRYPEFVLVGRGMYALREWGYNPGTVADVIASILKEDGPLSKKEIVKRVQQQRDVKVGTISLNLQKEDAFIRVGRAAYDFDDSKWNPKPSGRGRKKKAMLEAEEREKNKK
jgi:DNA-directed RNA polymerase delta subunit